MGSLVVPLIFSLEALAHASCCSLSPLQPFVVAPDCSMPLCMCLGVSSVFRGGGSTGHIEVTGLIQGKSGGHPLVFLSGSVDLRFFSAIACHLVYFLILFFF